MARTSPEWIDPASLARFVQATTSCTRSRHNRDLRAPCRVHDPYNGDRPILDRSRTTTRYAEPVTQHPGGTGPRTRPRTRLRRRLSWEIAIVLALSYGASAVYAIVAIIERITRETALASQTATINRPLADRAVFDLVYQLLAFAFGLAPVALVIYLLWQRRRPYLWRLGLARPAGASPGWWLRETGGGFALAAAIGIPGLAFYLFARTIGINANVVPTALDAFWWTVPVLVLSALRAALGEELIVVAYLFDRLRRIGLGSWAIITASALLRGSYHLYQGFGG
ncbi:MAG: CPBP family intramembrane metalloprotease, partial [Leucobacter sp.]|nr:CPBP family intramembrane metalloprotease [Leucobacter sp.]